MVIDDSLMYISLIVNIAVNAALFALLVILKIKKERISIFQFLSAIAAGLGYFYALKSNNLSFLMFAISAQPLLLILHCALFLYNPKKIPENTERANRFTGSRSLPTSGIQHADFGEMQPVQAYKDIMEVSVNTVSVRGELPQLLERINDIIMREMRSDGSAVLLVDAFEDLIEVRALAGHFPPPYKLAQETLHEPNAVETEFKSKQFPFEGNIFGEIVKSRKRELIVSPQNDSRIFQNGPEDFLRAGSYIFVPMQLRDIVIGVIALARKKESAKFSAEELTQAQILADFSSIAIKNAYAFQETSEHAELMREAYIAAKMQQNLYLQKIPALPAVSVGNFFNTAEGVCSDYFDIIPSRKDRISFVLADVTGKSVVSVTVTVMIRAMLRLIANTPQTAGTILSLANRGLALEKTIDHYASAVLLNYDAVQKKIQFATAGAVPVLHFRARTGEWEKISSESEPLGVEKNSEYKDYTIQTVAGDIIVLYTDGLVEAVNEKGEQYSAQRLKTVIRNAASSNGKRIAQEVKDDLYGFTGKSILHDDQSFVVLKIQ